MCPLACQYGWTIPRPVSTDDESNGMSAATDSLHRYLTPSFFSDPSLITSSSVSFLSNSVRCFAVLGSARGSVLTGEYLCHQNSIRLPVSVGFLVLDVANRFHVLSSSRMYRSRAEWMGPNVLANE